LIAQNLGQGAPEAWISFGRSPCQHRFSFWLALTAARLV